MPRVVCQTRWTTLLAVLFVLGTSGRPAAGQAWTQPAGSGYVKAFYGKTDAGEMLGFDGQPSDFISGLPGDTFRDRSLYLYTETGLSDRFTLIVSVPYKRLFVRDQAYRFRTYAFGSVTIGGRLAVLPYLGRGGGRNVVALNAAANLPVGYKRNYTPSGGAGQVDLQATVHYGRSFWPAPVYAQAGGGYRHRSSIYALSGAVDCRVGRDINCMPDVRPDYGDELLYSAEAGVTPFGGAILLQAMVGGVWSLGAPTVGFTALNPIPTHQRIVRFGGGAAVYPFRLIGWDRAASVGFNAQYFVTGSGRNTINARDLFVGIDYKPSF